MATTVGGIIRSSMRKIGVLAAGEPLPADEGEDARETLMQMLDAWTNETLLIPVVNEVVIKLLAGEPAYTVGIYPKPAPIPLPDNHLETARPERIIGAFIRDGSGTDYVQEQIDVKTFTRISRKENSSRPSRIYVKKGWPLNTLLFDSIPYANESLHMSVVQPLSDIVQAASLVEVINLPPGYARAIVYNLALDLADEWGKQPSAMTGANAIDGKKWLKRNNYRTLVLGMDRAVANSRRGLGTYNPFQGP